MFVYQPALLLIGEWTEILQALISSTFGTIVLASALEGWVFSRVGRLQRLILAVAGLCCIYPGTYTDLIGLALSLAVLVPNYRLTKKCKAA